MLEKEFLIEFGSDLKNAELTESKFDCTGYGEITLWLRRLCKKASFSFRDDIPSVRLIEVDGLNQEDIDDLNREVCWDELFDGEMAERFSAEQMANSGGPYYDFWEHEYHTELCYDE